MYVHVVSIVCVYICVLVGVCLCECMYMHVCISVCVFACVHMFIYMHIASSGVQNYHYNNYDYDMKFYIPIYHHVHV